MASDTASAQGANEEKSIDTTDERSMDDTDEGADGKPEPLALDPRFAEFRRTAARCGRAVRQGDVVNAPRGVGSGSVGRHR